MIVLLILLGICAALAIGTCMLGSIYSRDEERER
jgi:hypothetical protein